VPNDATPDAPDLPTPTTGDAGRAEESLPVQPASRRDDSRSGGGAPARSRVARLGLFGGTFDPPHVGHIAAAAGVRAALGLDAVWLVVANEPWQKVGQRDVSPVADRLAMVRAAARGIDGVEVSEIEIDRGGSSYTADTIATLHAEDPDRRLFVVVGADAAAGLPSWARADEVRVGATLVLVDRPGTPAGDLPEGWVFERVEIPRLDVSSTDLRRRVAEGRPVDGLVPVDVSSVIRERGLYRGPRV
jgi:nicotinate-nucleotide adenylyltransferase